MKKPAQPGCPCGSGQAYDTCCAPLHQGTPAATAEALMRSRYSAYVFGIEPYLLATWHASTRPPTLDLAAGPPCQWIGLKVVNHRSTGVDSAEVEFIARYKVGGRAHRLQERSRFRREKDRWYYVDGEFPADA